MNIIQRIVVLVACGLSIFAWIAYLKLDAPIYETGLYGMGLFTFAIAPLTFLLAFLPTGADAAEHQFLNVWYYIAFLILLALSPWAFVDGEYQPLQNLPKTALGIVLGLALGTLHKTLAHRKTRRKSGANK